MGQIDDDEDRGLETQVQTIVDRFTKDFEERVAQRFKDVATDADKALRKEVGNINERVASHVDTLEKANHLIHLTHINDF